jgi:CRP-like cAMP-binding protein
MKVKSLQAGEYLINEEDKHPDAFIIAQGTFYSYGVGESTSSRVTI